MSGTTSNANFRAITSSNSTLSLGVYSLYPTPRAIVGWGSDAAYEAEGVEQVVFMMGIDGRLSAGYVPKEKKMTVTLQADSTSNDYFESIAAYQEARQTVYWMFGTLLIPAINRLYTFPKGAMGVSSRMPSGRNVLQPRQYVFTWETILPTPTSAP